MTDWMLNQMMEVSGWDGTRPPKQTIWTTRDGQRIPIPQMTDTHLVNTIRYLRRQAEYSLIAEAAALGTYLDDNPPDGAYFAADAAERELLETDADSYLEQSCAAWEALLEESEKRGLDLQ